MTTHLKHSNGAHLIAHMQYSYVATTACMCYAVLARQYCLQSLPASEAGELKERLLHVHITVLSLAHASPGPLSLYSG